MTLETLWFYMHKVINTKIIVFQISFNYVISQVKATVFGGAIEAEIYAVVEHFSHEPILSKSIVSHNPNMTERIP